MIDLGTKDQGKHTLRLHYRSSAAHLYTPPILEWVGARASSIRHDEFQLLLPRLSRSIDPILRLKNTYRAQKSYKSST